MFTACFVQSPILTRKSCCSSHVSPTQRVIVTSCTHFEMEEQLVLFIQCKKSGIRRGGILSPLLLNIFAEWLISALKLSDLWCYIADCYVGCIALHMLMIWYYYLVHLHNNCSRCFSCVTDMLEAWTLFPIAKILSVQSWSWLQWGC